MVWPIWPCEEPLQEKIETQIQQLDGEDWWLGVNQRAAEAICNSLGMNGLILMVCLLGKPQRGIDQLVEKLEEFMWTWMKERDDQ